MTPPYDYPPKIVHLVNFLQRMCKVFVRNFFSTISFS